jgi:probable F420-dependent oxidoreductase
VSVNLPLRSVELRDHQSILDRLVAAGVQSVWADEFNGPDGVAALSAFSAWHPELFVTSAITNVFTRGSGLLAMSAATLAQLAPARATFGIGASSRLIVEGWNGLSYDRPYRRVAETLTFLRDVLSEGRSVRRYELLSVDGFRLAKVPDHPPRLALGALGPQMQRLAAAEADVLLTGMLSARDIARIHDHVADVARRAPGSLSVEIGVYVVPPGDPATVDRVARRHLTSYLPVPAYAAFQRWLGRGEALADMQDLWSSGDRRAAVAAIPEEVVAELVVTGTLDECVAGLRRYLEAGVDAINILIPPGVDIAPDALVEFLCDLIAAITAEGDAPVA